MNNSSLSSYHLNSQAEGKLSVAEITVEEKVYESPHLHVDDELVCPQALL